VQLPREDKIAQVDATTFDHTHRHGNAVDFGGMNRVLLVTRQSLVTHSRGSRLQIMYAILLNNAATKAVINWRQSLEIT